jgi:hypothetical protein
MEPTIQGFLDFHDGALTIQYEQYLDSLTSSRKDDIKSITDKLSNITIDKSIKKERKCGICGNYGHNRRTCSVIPKKSEEVSKKSEEVSEEVSKKSEEVSKKSEEVSEEVSKKSEEVSEEVSKKSIKLVIIKEEFDVISFRKELYDLNCGESKCDLCQNEVTNNMLCNLNDVNYCYNCYKSDIIDSEQEDLIINDHEKNCKCIECKTIPLSPRESQECNDLLNEDKNNYIQYEGVEYEYDYSSNIVSFEYDEIGIWNCDDEVVEWYNDDCEAIHLTNLSKK